MSGSQRPARCIRDGAARTRRTVRSLRDGAPRADSVARRVREGAARTHHVARRVREAVRALLAAGVENGTFPGAVAAVARALDWQGRQFPLVASGGVFEAGSLVLDPMSQALCALGCPAELHQAHFPPEVGAALLAARAAGIDTTVLMQGLAREATGGAR